MSDYNREDREDWEERSARRGYRNKLVQKPIHYAYRMQYLPKTPTVQRQNGIPKLGEIISTKEYGPAKVVEVVWRSNWHADVLLRRVKD